MPSGLRAVVARAGSPKGPRFYRDFPRAPGGPPVAPHDLAAHLERAVGAPLVVHGAEREEWEEKIAAVLVGLFVGAAFAPIRSRTSPKMMDGAAGPAQRRRAAIKALRMAAAKLEALAVDDLDEELIAFGVNARVQADRLAQKGQRSARPSNTVAERAIGPSIAAYERGFGKLASPAQRGPTRRFIEKLWKIAAQVCGIDPRVIGAPSAAWARAERALKARRG